MIAWYNSKQFNVAFLFIFFCVLIISFLTPPLQSPDEPNHLKRAYLLTKGSIFLSNENSITGGKINNGLLKYLDTFSYLAYRPEVKVSAPSLENAKKLIWSKEETFSDLPNTAVYFPISYVPQALGLIIGEKANLSINDTYYFCRLLSLLATLALLYLAFQILTPPPIVIACFLLPMTIFQMAAASLDSISFALAALSISLFIRGCHKNLRFTIAMQWLMTFCFFAIATTRLNFIFLTLLPLVIYVYRRNLLSILQALIGFIFASTWLIYSLLNTKGELISRNASTIQIIHYYLHHPIEYLSVLITTLTKWTLLRTYWISFVGRLGWWDTDLPGVTYLIFLIFFACLAYLTFKKRGCENYFNFRFYLLFILTLSYFSLFTMLLVAWTNHPTKIIDGIQGRYFIPFVIFIGYGFFDKSLDRTQIKKVDIILCSMLIVTMISTPTALMLRYWIN